MLFKTFGLVGHTISLLLPTMTTSTTQMNVRGTQSEGIILTKSLDSVTGYTKVYAAKSDGDHLGLYPPLWVNLNNHWRDKKSKISSKCFWCLIRGKKGSNWIWLVFAHPFPLNSGAPIASANFIHTHFI